VSRVVHKARHSSYGHHRTGCRARLRARRETVGWPVGVGVASAMTTNATPVSWVRTLRPHCDSSSQKSCWCGHHWNHRPHNPRQRRPSRRQQRSGRAVGRCCDVESFGSLLSPKRDTAIKTRRIGGSPQRFETLCSSSTGAAPDSCVSYCWLHGESGRVGGFVHAAGWYGWPRGEETAEQGAESPQEASRWRSVTSPPKRGDGNCPRCHRLDVTHRVIIGRFEATMCRQCADGLRRQVKDAVVEELS
jgi:hypothetical protein